MTPYSNPEKQREACKLNMRKSRERKAKLTNLTPTGGQEKQKQ